MQMKLTLTFIALILLCCAGATANAQSPVPTEKEEAIRRLLVLTKAGDLGVQIIEQALPQVKASLAMIPDEKRAKFLQVYEEEMRKDFTNDKMTDALIPIYDKYLTLDEIKQLIALYETPFGQKLIAVLPLITRDAYDDGMRRGQLTGTRILARVKSEGLLETPPPDVKPIIVPATKTAPKRSRRRH
jgi:hypothetical protein